MNNFNNWFYSQLSTIKRKFKRFRIKQIKEKPFKYKPFSKKQLQILTWWTNNSPYNTCDGIIADGAIRSGKTMSMSLSFGLWAMEKFNECNFLMCGKTIGSLRRNVVFDWKRQIKAQGFKIKEQRTDNLIILTKGNKTNYFYLFGGKDERSQDLVQGITAAGVFFDEVALQPESFVNQATGRCSVEGSKYWFNCNPAGPFHWFKQNWINRIPGIDSDAEFTDEMPAKNILYLHFTMDDNLSLSEEIKKRYKSMYQGVFYQRYIQGLWFIADGLIYDMFDKCKHKYSDPAPTECKRYIACDYGTTNPTVFLAIADNGKTTWVEKEYYYDSKKHGKQKTDVEYMQDFDKFVQEWGHKPLRVIIDPSASSFKLTLKKNGYHVKNADNDVLGGISRVSTQFAKEMLFIHESCINTIRELFSYAWNEKSSQNGKEEPVKQNDHAMDALRYFMNTIPLKRRFTIK